MKGSRSTYNLWIWFLVDACLWLGCLYAGLLLRFGSSVPAVETEYFLRLSPLATAGILGGFFYSGVYRRDVSDDWSWRGIWWGWVAGVGLSLAALFFLKIPYSRMAFITGSVLFLGGSVLLRAVVILVDRYWGSEQSVVGVGFDSDGDRKRLEKQFDDTVSLTVVSMDPSDPDYRKLQDLNPGFILINGRNHSGDAIRTLVNFGSRVQIPVRVLPSPDQLFFSQTEKVSWNGHRLLRSDLHYRLQQQMALKTVFDYVTGSILFVLLLPLLLMVSLLIAVVDGLPVLYTQERTGRGGSTFSVYKFRTMVPNADEKGPDLTEGPDDPRITALGRWLRRWSLDELPQLLNVLKGEMSLVGPRPEIPSITKDYDPGQEQVLWLKPGLTGLSQVRGRQELELDEKLEIDKEYLNEYSIGLDLWILLKTVVAVIRGRGAA